MLLLIIIKKLRYSLISLRFKFHKTEICLRFSSPIFILSRVQLLLERQDHRNLFQLDSLESESTLGIQGWQGNFLEKFDNIIEKFKAFKMPPQNTRTTKILIYRSDDMLRISGLRSYYPLVHICHISSIKFSVLN